jgi:hypothetical protein
MYRSKAKSPATKKFVKRERPKSIATDKVGKLSGSIVVIIVAEVMCCIE